MVVYTILLCIILIYIIIEYYFRLLRQWLCSPLCEIEGIKSRQDAITWLLENPSLVSEARGVLSQLPDLERMLSR